MVYLDQMQAYVVNLICGFILAYGDGLACAHILRRTSFVDDSAKLDFISIFVFASARAMALAGVFVSHLCLY